jgi:hypothetical protein
VPNRIWRLQFSAEMDIFKAEISGDERFLPSWNCDDPTVITNAEDSRRVASTLADTTDERFFGKRHANQYIRQMIFEK